MIYLGIVEMLIFSKIWLDTKLPAQQGHPKLTHSAFGIIWRPLF